MDFEIVINKTHVIKINNDFHHWVKQYWGFSYSEILGVN